MAVVAVVGRPNVGKSTLFNRLVERREAIVDDRPGVTRDRLQGQCEWNGLLFTLVDTGGLDRDLPEGAAVVRQAEVALAESVLVLFVVDGRQGVTPLDEEVARMLRRARRPVMLVVNKADRNEPGIQADFYALGFGEPWTVSALHGHGTGDLLDAVVARLPAGEAPPPADEVRLAIVGRPNVGKSTLLNTLLGEDRMVVSDVPGTTRDAVDVAFSYQGRAFRLVDTAGLRRRARVDDRLEKVMGARALRAIDAAQVVLLMIDATEGVTQEDQRIAGYTRRAGRAAIIAVNKWDLVEKDNSTTAEWERRLREQLHFIDYAGILFISARTGLRAERVLELAVRAFGNHRQRIPTPQLNQVVHDAILTTPPPADRGRRVKVFYVTQVATAPPRIVMFVNDPERMHASYQRHLERVLRRRFDFWGTPIRLVLRPRPRRLARRGEGMTPPVSGAAE